MKQIPKIFGLLILMIQSVSAAEVPHEIFRREVDAGIAGKATLVVTRMADGTLRAGAEGFDPEPLKFKDFSVIPPHIRPWIPMTPEEGEVSDVRVGWSVLDCGRAQYGELAEIRSVGLEPLLGNQVLPEDYSMPSVDLIFRIETKADYAARTSHDSASSTKVDVGIASGSVESRSSSDFSMTIKGSLYTGELKGYRVLAIAKGEVVGVVSY